MGYRLPEDRQHNLSTVADQSLITVDNGTISRISIPCFYDYPEDTYGMSEHRIIHDHLGWPSPGHPDDSCQLDDYGQTFVVNEINLAEEGYTDVEVCMTDRPEGLSVQTMLDENVVRMTIYAQCPNAETRDVDTPFSIYATGSFTDEEGTTMLRDVVTKGIMRVKAGSIRQQDPSSGDYDARISACEEEIEGLKIAEQTTRIIIDKTNSKLDALDDTVDEMKDDLEPRVERCETGVSNLNDAAMLLSDRINALDEYTSDHIDNHETRITACEAAIGGGGGGGGIDYGPRITTCETKISDLEGSQRTINAQMTNIDDLVNHEFPRTLTDHEVRIRACEDAIAGGGSGGGGAVSKTGKIYYVNDNITLDKTGITDVTTTITNFINTVPEGSTLVFEKGTYRVSTLAITKSLDVDFSGSTIVSSGNYGITFSGTLKRETTLSQKFEPYQSHVKLANSTGVAVGDLLVIYSNETLNPNRAYYRKAFTCIVSSLTDTDYGISIDVKCPFDVPSGASVKVYKPVSGSLRNIEKFQHSVDPLHNIVRSVQLNQACDFLIENVNCRQNIDYHIFVSESNHVIIQRCSIYVDRVDDDQDNHMYFVCIGGCSHTVMRDCHGVSNWHMWTTGGTTTTSLFSLVEGCTHVSMKAGSFVDHPAAIYTTIRDCQGTSAISISAGGTIENTIVTEYKVSDSDYYKPRFTCQAWGADYDFLNYNISNCKIVVNGDTAETNQNGAAINIVGVNGSGGTSTAWYARSISIDGVSSNRPVYMTSTPGISVKQVSLSNCHNIMPACAENTGDIVNLQMSNCVISGVPTLATFGHIYNNTVTTILMGLGTNTTINNLQLSDIPSGYAYCFVANSRERKLLINNLMDTSTQPLVISSTHNYLMVNLANCVGYLNAGSVLIDESLGASFPHLRIIGSVVYVIGNVSHDDAASTIITSIPS